MKKNNSGNPILPVLLSIFFVCFIFQVNLLAREKEFPLSMQKAIEVALQNNFDIAVEKINPKIAEENLTIENSVFDMTLFADTSIDKKVIPSASAFSSPDVNSFEDRNFSIGLKQALKAGASYKFNFSTIRTKTNSAFSGLDPEYSSFIDFELTQPLLKDFGSEVNTSAIKVAKNKQTISQKEFINKVIQIVSDIKNNYWELVFEKNDLKVKKQSLNLAKDMENRVRIQVEVGVLAPIEILQAQAEVAAREEAVIITENKIENLEDQLKTKLNFPLEAEVWNSSLALTDSPSFTTETFQLNEQIKTALENRPEMEQLKLDMANKEIDVEYKENQLYPTVDLVASFGLNGLSGDALSVTSFDGTTQVSRFGGDYFDSIDRSLSGDYYSYGVGIKFEYPLGNRSAKSSLAASKLEVKKALLTIKNLEQQIALEIKEAVRAAQTNIKRVHVTRVSKKLAEEKLTAEEKKFEVGLSTSFKVLEFQKDMEIEYSKENRAIIDYNKSLINLYRSAGITLQKNNIELK